MSFILDFYFAMWNGQFYDIPSGCWCGMRAHASIATDPNQTLVPSLLVDATKIQAHPQWGVGMRHCASPVRGHRLPRTPGGTNIQPPKWTKSKCQFCENWY